MSVSVNEIAPHDWAEKVHRSDILDLPEKLSNQPGYKRQSGTALVRP